MVRTKLPLAFTVLLVAHLASAADFHVTPSGSGNKDGTTWEHAFDPSALDTVVNERMKPGDTMFLGSAVYKDAVLAITVGGEGNSKTIMGVDRAAGLPVFSVASEE